MTNDTKKNFKYIFKSSTRLSMRRSMQVSSPSFTLPREEAI